MPITSMTPHTDVLVWLVSGLLILVGVMVTVTTGMAIYEFKRLQRHVDELYGAKDNLDHRLTRVEAQHELNHGRGLTVRPAGL